LRRIATLAAQAQPDIGRPPKISRLGSSDFRRAAARLMRQQPSNQGTVAAG
jgi:hypothetical protein